MRSAQYIWHVERVWQLWMGNKVESAA